MEINGFENYLIYDDGRVFSKKRNKYLKPSRTKTGYYIIGLYAKGKKKFFLVHRLVALHFIPNPYLKPQVDHIDGNKLNNHMINLRWVTNGENQFNLVNQKNNTSGHKGVCWNKKWHKWHVQIWKDNKRYYNGCYTTLEDAVKARDRLVKQLGIDEYYKK